MSPKRLLPALFLIVVLIFPLAPVYAQESTPIVKEIRYEGLIRTQENLISFRIRSEAGKPLSHDTMVEDQKRLIETGYFQDVSVRTTPVEGGIIMSFFFVEKPILHDVVVTGSRQIKTARILKKVFEKVGRGEIFDELSFNDAILEVEKLYRKRGFYDATIDYRKEVNPERNEVTIEIIIDEGDHGFIKQITIVGGEGVESRKVIRAMDTKRRKILPFLLGRGEFKKETFEDDKIKIRHVYQDAGYLDAKVTGASLEPYRGKAELFNLVITIDQGPLYFAGDISIAGNTAYPAEELTKNALLKKSDILSMKTADDERQRLRDYYSERGYVDVAVNRDFIPDPANPTVLNVAYRINEGPKVRIRKIDITGNITTKDKVIRRELLIVPNEMYDGVRVRTSMSRLRQLNYFSRVDIYTVDTDQKDVRDLIVEVEEKNTGQLIFGVGFSSIDNLVGSFEITQSNFDIKDWPTLRGGGQKARLRASAGSKRQDYVLSFTEPWLFDRKLSFGFDVFKYKKKYISDNYEQDSYGFTLRLHKEILRRTRGGVIYKWQKVDIDPDENASETIKAEEGERTISSLKFEVINDTRDRFILTSRGWYRTASFEYAGGFLGGDTDFTREQIELTKYLPLFWGHVLKVSGNYGTMEEFGDSDRVPIFERFFLGGRNTVRGYEFRMVGPKDETGEPIGGKSALLLSAEYTFPIYEDFLRGAVFYDTGNVWEESYEVDFDDMKSGWGVGLRILIPKINIPVNLDYSWPLDPDEFIEDKGRFDFSLGFNF